MAATARRSSSGRSRVGTTTLTGGRGASAGPTEVPVAEQERPGPAEGEQPVGAAHLAAPLLVEAQRHPALVEAHGVAGEGVDVAELDPAVADEAELAVGGRPAGVVEHAAQL